MAEQKWTMRGEYMESCNCDYLCPCIYTNPQAPVTYDHCTAALVFRIDEGSCGNTKLDWLKFALVIRSGKVMADGNWIFAGVVDERADEAQRQALAAIVGGQAGGPPGFIRENLVSDFRGIAYKPIEFDSGWAQAFDRDTRRIVFRDRRRRLAQPQRRAILHRQHGAPCGPPPSPGAREGNAYARLWPRPRSRGEVQ